MKFLDVVRRMKNCVLGQDAVHSYPILRKLKVVQHEMLPFYRTSLRERETVTTVIVTDGIYCCGMHSWLVKARIWRRILLHLLSSLVSPPYFY